MRTIRGGVNYNERISYTFCGIKSKLGNKQWEHDRFYEEILPRPGRKKQPRPQGILNNFPL